MTLDVLIIDDEKDIRELVSGILKDEGFVTRTAKDSTEAIEQIRQKKPDIVILDVWLNDSRFDGIQLLDIIQEQKASIPVIMVSGHGTIEVAVKTLKRGAYDFLEKPFTADRLVTAVQKSAEYTQLKQENDTLKLKNFFDQELVGKSEAIQDIKKVVEKVSATNSRVFITGQVGSGKENIARFIHRKSLRAKGIFLEYNCAEKNIEKAEIDIFGKISSNLGQSSGVVGILEQANNGTLYLKNVLEMPENIQKKFVRILQKNSFKRIDGTTSIPLNVRIISSSVEDPSTYIQNRLFREDLYYRLAIISINVPSLCQRREDIPCLVEKLIKSICTSYNIEERQCSDSAINLLKNFNWPGNIRQLKNALEWAIVTNLQKSRKIIQSSYFSSEIRGDIVVTMQNTPKHQPEAQLEEENWKEDLDQSNIFKMPLREAREIFEKYYLKIQVNRFGGNISRTSTFVEMERSALHRKLKTLNIHKIEK